MRVCPIVPGLILNFILGITKIKLRDYIIGGVGMLPGQVLRLFIGTTISSLTQDEMSFFSILSGEYGPLIIATMIIGVILGISGTTYITIVTKRYLK